MACAVLDPIESPRTSLTTAPQVAWPSGLLWNRRIAVALVGMMIGTGGAANALLINRVPRTGSQFRVIFRGGGADRSLEQALLPQEQMAGIQRYLSANLTDLARVLRIARPTVYAWLRGAEPHGFNLERIAKLYRIARGWRAMSSAPLGKFLNVRFPDGGSVLDLLSEEIIDEPAVNRSFTDIKLALDQEHQRPGIWEAARARGLQPAEMQAGRRWSSDDDLNF
jgi:hypothetical protein